VGWEANKEKAMKLNWPNYIFLMTCVTGYFLFTKPIDSWLIGVIAAMGILLAIPTYFGSRKEAKDAKDATETVRVANEQRSAQQARKAADSGVPAPKKPAPSAAIQGSAAAAKPTRSPAQEALLRAIEAKRKEDPLIGAKLGAKEIVQWLLVVMKNEKGVHIESLLAVLGALAGYSCQASVRARQGRAAFIVADGADGKKYFFGDALNKPLAEDKYSVWGLAAGAAQKNGCESLPDLNAIFKHTAESVGGKAFGIPRLPANHQPGDAPVNYLKVLWPKTLTTLEEFCAGPSEWPILLGLSIQEAIFQAKSAIDPRLALEIVMECAIPMSKVDLSDASQ
jgi:hypothetical protein